jgi:gliding motility-associated lipoprotein GldD
MTKLKRINLIIILLFVYCASGCKEVSVPKPRGYFRIDLPAKSYLKYNENPSGNLSLPFSFEYPAYGQLSVNKEKGEDPGWFNIEFPVYNAKIYLTYKNVGNDFAGLMEQTYKMNVKNHITKADAINEVKYVNQENRVYGVLYDLKGNTASAVQFYITDSVKHYLRGSLYFTAEPDADSLAPVISFFREDIIHLIETLKWEK